MKKISYLIVLFTLLLGIVSCTGYKPIFSSSGLKFEIASYSTEGEKKIGNQIISKLKNLSKINKNNPDAQSIDVYISTLKTKNSTVKNTAGKILEYKITINSTIKVKDYLTEKVIFEKNFYSFSSYRVQDEYSETKKLENKTIENLINKIYQDLLIKMSETINPK